MMDRAPDEGTDVSRAGEDDTPETQPAHGDERAPQTESADQGGNGLDYVDVAADVTRGGISEPSEVSSDALYILREASYLIELDSALDASQLDLREE